MNLNVWDDRINAIAGADVIFHPPQGQFCASTVLITSGRQRMTVADALRAAGYIVDFIKANFDVNVKKYSETILLMKAMNLALNNQPTTQPGKEQLHYAVDVIHEITDMQETCPETIRANAKIAFSLNAMIELFSR